jgi:ribonuclease HI
VNVDGAFRLGVGQAGAGAIIRDDKGGVVIVRWEPTPAVSPLHAEAWAMQMGLSLLSGDQFVEVESDSEQLVKILREEGPCPWQVQGIVRECKATLAKLAEYTISHVCRSGNRAADWAARRGLGATQTGSLREGDPMPPELYALVEMDSCPSGNL